LLISLKADDAKGERFKNRLPPSTAPGRQLLCCSKHEICQSTQELSSLHSVEIITNSGELSAENCRQMLLAKYAEKRAASNVVIRLFDERF
jgi:hypothetical protein